MAATFGKVEEFDSKKEEWSQYVEKLQHFFVANDIVDAEKKGAVFLSVVGPAIDSSQGGGGLETRYIQ